MRLLLSILLTILSSGLSAQNNFASVRLHKLYDLLPQTCKNEVGKSELINCHVGGNALTLKVINDNGQINHVGLKIFDKQENGFYPEVVFNFIECYLLEMMLTDDLRSFYKRTDEQKIIILLNGKEITKSLSSNRQNILFVLNHQNKKRIDKDSLNYAVSISDEINQLQMVFPVNNNLICGMDKQELDKTLEQNLRKFKSNSNTSELINQDQSFEPIKEIFKLRGDSYFKSITSDKYYIKYENEFRWLYDKKYPAESLANTFMNGHFEPDKKIVVNHHQYGKEISRYDLNLNDFIAFFKTEKCKIYFGIEDESADKLQATMVIYNSYLNFINIVYINTTADVLFDPKQSIDIKLYSNIPSDNIKNLFGVYDENKKAN